MAGASRSFADGGTTPARRSIWWAPPPAPVGPKEPRASRIYLLPMFGILGLILGLVLFEFTSHPLPPGVDPGHWLSTAYAYVGLPTAPDPANRPLFYSPLMFPILGGLVWLTQSPPLAATILAGLFLAGYGLTVIHLARRFLRTGVVQVAFVGVALFCGTTLQMLFWGAYPNYLGFIFLNEALIFFLLWVRERRSRDGALFYAALLLAYFGHDLTFMVLVASIALSAIFLLLFRKMSPRFFSNSSAYFVDEIGEIFQPLGHDPAFLLPGPIVYVSPRVAVAILLSATVISLVVFALVHRFRPDRLNARLLITGGWLSGAAAVPALGYLAHIDTDYTRFVYFLPLPFILLAAESFEQAFARLTPLGAPEPVRPPPRPRGDRGRYRPRPYREARGSPAVAASVVGLLLTVLFFSVTVPVAQANEAANAGGFGHDAQFVQAAEWLGQNPAPGAVLCEPGEARWTEALSDRSEYTVGPVWLLFDTFQIYNAEETYWAANSEYAVTNGQVVLSYSGFNTTVFSQAPLYTAYVQGVPFPVLRVLPGSISIVAAGPGGASARTVPALGGASPLLNVSASDGGAGTIIYRTAAATITEAGFVDTGGNARIQFLVQPAPRVTVRSLSFALDGIPFGALWLQHDRVTGLSYSAGQLDWNVTGPLGQYPSPWTARTTVAFSEAPAQTLTGALPAGGLWQGTFPDPNGSAPYELTLYLSTPHTSNPATALPRVLASSEFLASQSIQFVLWPTSPAYQAQLYYFEQELGFRPVFQNSEWMVLQR
jgi:hypothetical protein